MDLRLKWILNISWKISLKEIAGWPRRRWNDIIKNEAWESELSILSGDGLSELLGSVKAS